MTALPKSKLFSCENGATAVEFALALPPFLMLVLGTLSACVAVYAAASLHFAVEGAARYFSIHQATTSAAQSYAQSRYFGPYSPTFTAATASCGYQVSGSLGLVLTIGVAQWNIPLRATACFP